MKPLRDGSAIYIKDSYWVCEHGVGYPDVCNECPETFDFMKFKVDLVLWRLLAQR